MNVLDLTGNIMELYTYVKSVVESRTCPAHNQKPLIAANNANFDIACCCTEFKISCLNQMLDLLTEYKEIQDSPRSPIRKNFGL